MPGTASQAIKVLGTKLEMYDDAGVAVSAIADLVGFDISKSRETIDVTHMDSPDGYREFQVSLKNGGSVPLELHWVPGNASHAQFEADFESGFLRKYKITLPAEAGSETEEFNARVTNVSKPYKLDDVFRMNVTLMVSGSFT